METNARRQAMTPRKSPTRRHPPTTRRPVSTDDKAKISADLRAEVQRNQAALALAHDTGNLRQVHGCEGRHGGLMTAIELLEQHKSAVTEADLRELRRLLEEL